MPRVPFDEDCPGEEDIAALMRGGLSPPRMRTMEAHVSHCSACRQLLSALARVAGVESRPASDSASPTLPQESGANEIELQPGARFGRYVVVEWLGAGGMGVVYSAYDPELNRKVALKVLGNPGAGPADRVPIYDLLLREARAMAQLAHPNVVTVFDVGSVGQRVFIAMELVEGVTLAQWLSARRREPSEIITMFLAAGNGLAAAHAAGLIHGDFKPDNVLVGNDGRVRVTDFGLAREAPPPEPRRDAEVGPRPRARQTGLAGTRAYMAPEQFLRQSTDARADQFSFAVALYEALHGERPFDPPWFSAEQAMATPRTVAISRGSGVPARLHKVLLRALNRDPGERFPSMRELLAALAPRPRCSNLLVGAIIVAAVGLSATGYVIHLRHAAEQRTELVGHLRGLASELRTLLRSAQSAWTAGERGSHIDAALGYELGATYANQLNDIEHMVASSHRDAQLRTIEQRYREPAILHLRAALAAGASSPAYLEALTAFHEGRFADASRIAHAAFAESPTFYEAGVVEANAHHEAACVLLAADRIDEAKREFTTARQIFEHVLEIARSDAEVWLGFAEMVYAQAIALARGKRPADLRQQAIAALHTARELNPESWQTFVREAEIYEGDATVAISWYRDPGPYVDQVLTLASQARAHGAYADQVDALVCLAHWERAVYQGSHGVDPRPAFAQAIAACERAVAAKPDADNHATLGTVYSSLASYEADHRADPAHAFERSERNLRVAIRIDEDTTLHYSVGRLWTKAAHYQASHGQDPQHAVDHAVLEFRTVWTRLAAMCGRR